MKFPSLALAALAGAAVQLSLRAVAHNLDGWLLSELYTLTLEELDPIIAPNAQSSHMHRILGATNFAAAYNFEELAASTCTTAAITVDNSAYWAPQLYWILNPEDPAGTSFLQMAAVTKFAYFLGRNEVTEPVQAWPEGFKMIAGNPNNKVPGTYYQFQCYRNLELTDTIQSDDFNFDDPCLGGIKFDLYFPACWDGVNLYKPDQSHTAYPTISPRGDGPCPATHPVRLPTVLLQYTYHPADYATITQGQNLKGHLSFANGDTTGYGVHGDFLMGWNREILTKALNDPACVGIGKNIAIQDCPVFAPYYDVAAAAACKPARGQLIEPYPQVDGAVVPRLPGCNLLWGLEGPKPTCDPAIPAMDVTAFKSTAGPDVLPALQQYGASLPTEQGWYEVGCFHNNAMAGTLNYYDANMTLERCQDTCKKNGYSYAGLSTGSGFHCLCDNELNKDAGFSPSACTAPCPSGNGTCGGPVNLDIYYQAPEYVTPDSTVYDLGCYKLQGDAAEDNLIKTASYTFTLESITRELCSSCCSEKGAAYSAVQDKTCYCGNSLITGPGFYVPSDLCTHVCAGDANEVCGDVDALSVANLANYKAGTVSARHAMDKVPMRARRFLRRHQLE